MRYCKQSYYFLLAGSQIRFALLVISCSFHFSGLYLGWYVLMLKRFVELQLGVIRWYYLWQKSVKVLYKTPDCLIRSETVLLQIVQKNYSCCCGFSVWVRSRSIGCWLRKKKNQKVKPTHYYGPIWMTKHCSMCGKMAAVQCLEPFIFW